MMGLRIGALELVVDPHLDWQMWRASSPLLRRDMVIVGVERAAQLMWQVETQQRVLESDPGPLDAKVP